ncbi:MAG: GNAT family N-acetyltransferase [Clostridia bacterium]|nr:GNAT family N-acetyltransferase [Clostridia bacterium]
MNITYDRSMTAEEYMDLRNRVGWMQFPQDEAKNCIDNAFFICCVRDDRKPTGCVRLVWDGGYTAYLSDVLVLPEYQGQGIGRELVTRALNALQAEMKPGWKVKVALSSARGKEGFYEKFGFRVRPNEDAGPGMDRWFEGY